MTEFQPTKEIFLLLENLTKSNNLGPTLRCATAFGIRVVIAVGFAKCSTEGSHGAAKHVQIINFPTTEQANRFLRQECNCTTIIGLLGSSPNSFDDKGYNVQLIENTTITVSQTVSNHECDESNCNDNNNIDNNISRRNSYPAHCNRITQYGNGNIGLVVSKDNRGLPLHLSEVCDSFVHVPYPLHDNVMTTNNTPARLINFASCLSITLHELTAQLRYNENTFCGTKFSVSLQKPSWNKSNTNEATTGNTTVRSEVENSDTQDCLNVSKELAGLFATEYDESIQVFHFES